MEKSEDIPQTVHHKPSQGELKIYKRFYFLRWIQLLFAIVILILEVVQVAEFEAYFTDAGADGVLALFGISAQSIYFTNPPFGKGPAVIWAYVAIVFTIIVLVIYIADFQRIFPHVKHSVFIGFERALTILWITEAFAYIIWSYNINKSPCGSGYSFHFKADNYEIFGMTQTSELSMHLQNVCGAYVAASVFSWLMLFAVAASTAVAWLLHDPENGKLNWSLFMLTAFIPKLRNRVVSSQKPSESPAWMDASVNAMNQLTSAAPHNTTPLQQQQQQHQHHTASPASWHDEGIGTANNEPIQQYTNVPL